jgi:hypothetical protein
MCLAPEVLTIYFQGKIQTIETANKEGEFPFPLPRKNYLNYYFSYVRECTCREWKNLENNYHLLSNYSGITKNIEGKIMTLLIEHLNGHVIRWKLNYHLPLFGASVASRRSHVFFQ